MSGAEHLGPYLLEVKEGVFPLGGDSLALGAFATVKRGWRVCDLGTGSGCLLLMLAAREGGLSLTGVEREERAAQCARENLAHSGLEGTVLQADWRLAGSTWSSPIPPTSSLDTAGTGAGPGRPTAPLRSCAAPRPAC